MNKKVLLLLLVASSVLSLWAQTPSEWPPQADDSFWRDSIPTEMRQSYIAYGEQYLGKPWTTLPWTVFAENKITGNRVNYERLCFDKRRQLAALVMAEVMEGKGRFLNDIIDGMGSFCEETWWGIPAHYNKRIPLTGQQEVDLFNAETASLIAWTRYMLQRQFEQFSPDLCQRIDHEIEQRILVPALSKDYWWKKASMNWNPWICSNWLTCVLICEQDNTRKQQAIAQIEKATQAFIDAYPSDGGCDEGPSYWDRAAASMFEVARLLFSGQWIVDSYAFSPLLIDPGVGEYTAQTFSKDRYQIWTMQSAYHNLPQINGCDQKDGKQHAARLVSHKDGQLCLDIAAAYPEEAAVKSWKRTVTATKSGISVTEDYQLSDFRQPSRLMFMTTNPDALSHFDYDHRQLSAEVEDISSLLDPILQRMWGDKMYRLVFTVRSTATKNKIKYTIR